MQKFFLIKDTSLNVLEIDKDKNSISLVTRTNENKNKYNFYTNGSIEIRDMVITFESKAIHNLYNKRKGLELTVTEFKNAEIYCTKIGISDGDQIVKVDDESLKKLVNGKYNTVQLSDYLKGPSKITFAEAEFENIEDAALYQEVI